MSRAKLPVLMALLLLFSASIAFSQNRAPNATDRRVSITPATLIGSTVWTSQTASGWVPRIGDVLDFQADGTGVSFERVSSFRLGLLSGDPNEIPEPFTWTISNGTLNLEFPDVFEQLPIFAAPPYTILVTDFGFPGEVATFMSKAFSSGAFQDSQVPITKVGVSRTVAAVSALRPGKLRVKTTDQSEYSMDDLLLSLGWQGMPPRGVASVPSNKTLYAANAHAGSLPSTPSAGDTWALPIVYRPNDPLLTEPSQSGLYADLVTLEQQGTTSDTLLGGLSFSWFASSHGLILGNGADRYSYLAIESTDAVIFALVTYEFGGVLQLRSAEWIARADGTGAGLGANLVVPQVPEYWQTGLGNWLASAYDEQGQLKSEQIFGYSFSGDGTSYRIFSLGMPNCLQDPDYPCIIAESGNLWTWSVNGNTIVRDQTLPFPRVRTWNVLRHSPGGRSIAFERELTQLGNDPWMYRVTPRINSLEVMDLTAWPEEYADSEGFPGQ